MPEFLSSLSFLYVIPVLGFMILIHEFGHYAVAKWLGVRVEVFSIGFGKRLFGFRKPWRPWARPSSRRDR